MRVQILLVLLAVVSSCNKPTNVFIDPSLSTLIPQNAESLIGVRLDKIKQTEIYKKYLANRRFESLDELAVKTGLDPRKDFYEILVASTSNEQLLLVHGKFGDAFGKEPTLKIPDTARSRYKGYELLGSDQGAVTFLNSSVAAVGKPAVLRTLIDGRDNPKAGIPPQLQDLLNRVPYSAQFWAVTIHPENLAQFPTASNLSNLNQMLQRLQNLIFAADFQEGFAMQAQGEARAADGRTADQNAKQMSDLVKGLIGLARINTPSNKPELLRFLDSAQTEAQGPKVRISLTVPPDLIDQALKYLPETPAR